MKQAYAGIGARTTPPDVLAAMERIAAGLATYGWTLRTGGARGADTAFEKGARSVQGACEVFLPWNGYNPDFEPGKKPDPKAKRWDSQPGVVAPTDDELERAASVALKVWPTEIPWDRMKSGARKLQARNSFQVLGRSLSTPVTFVVYWAEDDYAGGTAQALRLARHYGIPTYKVGALDNAGSVLSWHDADRTEPLSLDVRQQTHEEERHWSEWDDRDERDQCDLRSFDHHRPEVFDGLYDD